MELNEIRALLKTPAYDFLRTNQNLGGRIALLTLGGSHAYGTAVEGSDVDIRGFALNGRTALLTGEDFEQVTDVSTDTVVYSADKLIRLLSSNNPNTIEILGCRPEHYLYLSQAGRLVLDNTRLFLSRRAVNAFAGYAGAQLRRLENKTARSAAQSQQEKHILRSIERAMLHIRSRCAQFPNDALRLYTDVSEREGYDAEIYMDVTLTHYPLRDYVGLWSELNSIVRSYNVMGKRNENAMSHGKLGKHMMHLVRLYYMCFDILERGEIVTYREKEHDLLMSIRNGAYLDENDVPTEEFAELLNALDERMERAERETELPAEPDKKRLRELHAAVNELALRA